MNNGSIAMVHRARSPTRLPPLNFSLLRVFGLDSAVRSEFFFDHLAKNVVPGSLDVDLPNDDFDQEPEECGVEYGLPNLLLFAQESFHFPRDHDKICRRFTKTPL